MKQIDQEIANYAKKLENLSKSQTSQEMQIKTLLKAIKELGPEGFKKSLKNLSDDQKEILMLSLQKASAASWYGAISNAPKTEIDSPAVHLPSIVERDFDAQDEDLMNFAQTGVKHQGDNSTLGFDGQEVNDPKIINKKNMTFQNPSQSKKFKEIEYDPSPFPQYESESVLNQENIVKPDPKAQLADNEEQEQGHYKKLYPVRNDTFDFNNKVKKENERKMKKAESVGEGSRGGKIIGHTSTGHPIYEDSEAGRFMGLTPFHRPVYDKFNHPAHKNFTRVDHAHAADMHGHMARRFPKGSKEHQHHAEHRNAHHSEYDTPGLQQFHNEEEAAPRIKGSKKTYSGKNEAFGNYGIAKPYISQRIQEHRENEHKKMHKSEEKSKKFEDCVMDIKHKGDKNYNPWAVCHSVLKKHIK